MSEKPFQHISFCHNKPCEAEAVNEIIDDDDPIKGILLLCLPCTEAFEWGQSRPSATITPISIDVELPCCPEDTEDDEFFLRKAENAASYPGEVYNPGYWGPGKKEAERRASDNFLDELATYNDEHQEIQDNKS